MADLKIIKATYYAPQIGTDKGTDVTEELSSEIEENRLVYKGRYNDIFPDNFTNIVKKLKIDIEYKGKKYQKFYSENDRINLPADLGDNTYTPLNKKKPDVIWWKRLDIVIPIIISIISIPWWPHLYRSIMGRSVISPNQEFVATTTNKIDNYPSPASTIIYQPGAINISQTEKVEIKNVTSKDQVFIEKLYSSILDKNPLFPGLYNSSYVLTVQSGSVPIKQIIIFTKNNEKVVWTIRGTNPGLLDGPIDKLVIDYPNGSYYIDIATTTNKTIDINYEIKS